MKNYSNGITLVEIVVVVFIIALFSTILISNFPKIERQFALSRATYKLAQDLRKTEDLGLSGLQTKNYLVKGYGIYVSLSDQFPKKYVIYADIDGDQKYNGSQPYSYCEDGNNLQQDCVLEAIDVSQSDPSVYIKNIQNINIGTNYISINFNPPDVTNIDNISQGSAIGIVLGLKTDSNTRTVWVNKSGLIWVQ